MSKFKGADSTIGAIAIAFVLVFATMTTAITIAPNATAQTVAQIWTDKDDYLPGQTVIIEGSGFLPDTAIIFSISNPDNFVNTWTANSDSNGNVSTNYFLDAAAETYTVTATDGTNTAQTTFTDATLKFVPSGLADPTTWTATCNECNPTQTISQTYDPPGSIGQINFGGEIGGRTFSIPVVSGGTGIRFVPTSASVSPTTSLTFTASTGTEPATGSVTVLSTGNTQVTITFTTQYLLTIGVSPSGAGSTSPTGSGLWYNAGSVVGISASAGSGYAFSSWTGSGTGSYTGTTTPSSVTMNAPITETANFILSDTTAPTVVSITPLPSLINEATAAIGDKAFTLTIVFNEDMKASPVPTISFPVEDPSLTISFDSGSWTNTKTYVAKYDVTDNNQELANVDVGVSTAQDVAGNPMVADTTTGANNFDIDTTAPTVTDVSVTDPVISEADVGLTFTVTITYSEAMDQTVNPTIGFSPAVGTTLTLPTSDAWSDSTHFSRSYTVADGNVELQTSPDVTIQVSAAKDLAGNTQTAYDASDAFTIDTIAPTVTGSADRSPDNNGWYNHDVTITWSSPDTDDTCDAATVYSGPDTNSGGTNVPGGSCTDDVDNVGTAAAFALKYDETDPTLNLPASFSVFSNTNSYTYSYSTATYFTDPTPGSGIDSSLTGCLPASPATLSLGSNTISCTATDNAGNTATGSYTVTLYKISGFYQPIDMNGVYNKGKAGNTIPYKFNIYGAGGTEITDLGIFNSIKMKPIACPVTGNTDTIEEFSTASNSGIKYDTAAHQFVYTGTTLKTQAGFCYTATLYINSVNGPLATITADIMLTKT